MKRTRGALGGSIWFLLGASTLLAAAGTAIAADENELIRRGVELRRKGDDAGALELFQQASDIGHSPRAKAQVGLAEQALGRWVAAYEHLHEAMRAKTDPWIVKNRAAIDEALKHLGNHIGAVVFMGGVAGAHVRIDGVSRGTLPFAEPVPVSTGTVIIELSLPGHMPIQRSTVVRPGETVRESFGAFTAIPVQAPPAQSPRAETPPPPAPPPVAAPQVGEASIGASSTPPAPMPEPSSGEAWRLRSSAKWMAWGLGAVALGAGVFGTVRQRSSASDFGTGCGVDAMGTIRALDGSPKTDAQCLDLKGAVDSGYTIEIVGLVSAAVLGATGFVLWLTEEPKSTESTTALACSPGLAARGGPWLGCSLRF